MKLFVLCFLFTISVFAQVGDFFLQSDKTLYIVDGDSISLQMRIRGIDTPEVRQTCEKTPNQIIDCGRLAKRYLKSLLRDLPGKLRIEPKGVDHYHRVLVNVYKADVNIGKLMVEHGIFLQRQLSPRRKQRKSTKVWFLGFSHTTHQALSLEKS